MPNRSFSLVLLILWAHSAVAEEVFPPRERVPAFAVLPLVFPKDPDYGVFMADRLVVELMHYRDVPAWQRRRFEMVEPDTLDSERMERILSTRQALKGEDLEALRSATRADWVLLGSVSETGTRTLQLRIVDLSTGEPRWFGRALDDSKWMWIYAHREVGEIVLGNVMRKLGFEERDRRLPVLSLEELPQKVVLRRFYTERREIVGAYERRVREGIGRDALFETVEGGRPESGRLGADDRRRLRETQGVDAALCGSFMVWGKDEAVNTAAVALRLVEVPSGRILWADSASGRKVWRKDRLDEMTRVVAAQLVTRLAKIRTGVVETELAAVPDPVDGLGWAGLGTAYLQRGLLDQAEEAFLKAVTFPKSQALAYSGLGQIYARRPTLRNRAVSYFHKAVEIDSTYAEAYYHMARTYVDMEISLAVDMALRAISIDSTYTAPYLLIADWFAKGDWYSKGIEDEKAIRFYIRYLSLEPEDIEAAVRLGQVLLRVEDYGNLERHVLPLLTSHPEATDLLSIAAQWAYRMERYDTSAGYWARYLDRVEMREKEAYIDLEPVLTEAEGPVYRALSAGERRAFEARLWNRRDPDRTTEVNERQLEHYGRVWTARRSFSEVAYPWDRRGEVYIRYGEPDYRSRSNRVPSVMSPAVQQIKDRLYSELYESPSTEALVGTVFPVRTIRTMVAQEAGLSFSADSHTMGEGYGPVTSSADYSDVPWESWVYVEVGGGIEVTFTDELGSGHFDFAPVPPRRLPGMRSVTRMMEHSPEVAFTQAIRNMPDLHRPWEGTRSLDFYYSLADFRGGEGNSLLDIAYGLPTDLFSRVGKGEALELSVALANSDYGRIVRWKERAAWRRDEGEERAGTLLTVVAGLEIDPGRYHLTVKVRNARTDRFGMFHQDVDVEAYRETGLQVSDLVLAAQIQEAAGPSPFQKGELQVVPLPSRAYAPAQKLGLYYEIYNLTADAFGQTRYRVTVQVQSEEETSRLARLLRGAEVQPEVSLSYEQIGDRDREQVYLFVDLEKVKPGRNRLVVTIQDLNASREATKEGMFRYGQ